MAFEKLRKFLTSQQTLNFNLAQAAEKSDVEGVKKWIAKGGKSVSTSDWRNDSALQKAIEANSAEIVKLLLDAGADPNAKGRYGEETPFLEAARKGNAEICAAMIAAKADVNVRSSGGNTPYLYAVSAKNQPLIEALDAAGAKQDIPGRDGWTPLFYAVRNNDVKTVNKLLKAGVRTDRTDDEGRNVLDVARAYDRPEAYKAVQVFLDAQVPEWQVTGASEIAHVMMRRPQGYKLTDIFNFETKERTLITHNYETGRDSVERGKFEDCDMLPVQLAERQLKALKV